MFPTPLGYDDWYVLTLSHARSLASSAYSPSVRVRQFLQALILTENLATQLIKVELDKRNYSLGHLYDEIEISLQKSKKSKHQKDPDSQMRYSRNAIEVMNYAKHFAMDQGLVLVGCDHLLLGIYESRDLAADILISMHVERSAIENELAAIMAI